MAEFFQEGLEFFFDPLIGTHDLLEDSVALIHRHVDPTAGNIDFERFARHLGSSRRFQ